MGRRDARHGSPVLTWIPVVLVVLLLVAAGTAYLVGPSTPDPDEEPAAVPPPPGLTLPALRAPSPVAQAATDGRLDPAKVRRALAPVLRDHDLGRHVLASVAELDGSVVYDAGAGPATPASNLKLLTTTAALETLGPQHAFHTTAVAAGPHRVVLVGGGDPLLARRPAGADARLQVADVTTLARSTAQALEAAGHTRVRVGYDASLFDGPMQSPWWEPGYVPEEVSPISALWVDEGRSPTGYGLIPDPAAAAAGVFAGALAKHGVKVVGGPVAERAPAGAAELAHVTSPPLYRIVEHTLETSDNNAAEVLARHVGRATGGAASFAGGARAVLAVLDRLGVPTDDVTTYDGSGLSRHDRVDPDSLTAVLALAGSAQHPDLRAVLTGLPVAGFTGSLVGRLDVPADALGRGVVRAKTGTLTGVSGLAGTVTDRDGRPMVFAVLADRIDPVDTYGARAALDAATSALAECHCGR